MAFKFNPFSGTLDYYAPSSSGGGVTGPGSSTRFTIPTWDDTAGATLRANSNVYIDSTGSNIGLAGATSPTKPLQFGGGTPSAISRVFLSASFADTTSHFISLKNTNNECYWSIDSNFVTFGSLNGASLLFVTNNTTAITVDTSQACTFAGACTFNSSVNFSGNVLKVDSVNSRVGINVASPGSTLQIGNGATTSLSGAAVSITYNDTSNHGYSLRNNTGTSFWLIDSSQTTFGNISNIPLVVRTNNADRITINGGGDGSWVFDTSTGFKFGTSTAQKLAFFNKTPVAQQTGGAQTASGTYGATEQSMLQTAYDCLRIFGFLS